MSHKLAKGSGLTVFPVDDVTPAATPIWTESLANSLTRRFMRKIVLLPEPTLPVINEVYDSLSRKLPGYDPASGGAGSRCHPLIEAVQIAFSQHRPLVLSPDCVWLAIAQGFGHHLTMNAEALRYRIVRHAGERQLNANLPGWSLEGCKLAIAGFSAQIREASDPVLHETLVCDFSTTTPEIRTASEVVLMDTYSSYFRYQMWCVCGIPSITLTGSVDDWQRMRERIEVLNTYELQWWIARLRPILDEFIQTIRGHPNREFWQAIYKPQQAYATTLVTGWITDLFPYLGDRPEQRRSHVFRMGSRKLATPCGNDAKHSEVAFHSQPEYRGRNQGFPFWTLQRPIRADVSRRFNSQIGLDSRLLRGRAGPRGSRALTGNWLVRSRTASANTCVG
jgi:hypothetical protein